MSEDEAREQPDAQDSHDQAPSPPHVEAAASAPTPAWTPDEYQERTGKTLLPQHHALLAASGISLDIAAAAATGRQSGSRNSATSASASASSASPPSWFPSTA